MGIDLGDASLAGLFALAGSFIGSQTELRKLNKQRFIDREEGFERAQIGYRACYRKFLDNLDGYRSGKADVDVATLLSNFREAAFTGDPIVLAELEAFWPPERRAEQEPPSGPPPKSLESAMFQHGSRSLKQQLKLKDA
jgi:hypothetical protein